MKANTLKAFSALLCVFANDAFAMGCEEGGFFKALSLQNGRRQVGECLVEMHLCEKTREDANLPSYMKKALGDNSQYWIGDIYVKHSNGSSLYVPVYSQESRFPNTSIGLEEKPKFSTYYYKDYNHDPVSGYKEAYEVEFSKGRNRIEFRMKNSRESRMRPLRSLFFPNVKIICE